MLPRFLAACLIAACAALPAAAQSDDAPLETLDTWGKTRGWEGVGLLDLAGEGLCTGTLIRNDIVLTAAHCLYHSETGDRLDPARIEFRAGWRGGKAVARRRVENAVIHSKYLHDNDSFFGRVRYDVAILKLDDPILPTHANPFRYGRTVGTNVPVSVVSYGRGRFDALSRQRSCGVLDSRSGLLVTTCRVEPGSSGSPIFALRDGRPEIVSVVSGMGTMDGREVSFGMDSKALVDALLRDLRAGRGIVAVTAPSARRVGVGAGRSAGGAKFVRP